MNAKHWTREDETLKDSFPASDPPAWNQGREHAPPAKPTPEQPRKGPGTGAKRKPDRRIQIGPKDV
jgi:hypothetical protein